jgi:DNA polymerase elongation subunit (family B)
MNTHLPLIRNIKNIIGRYNLPTKEIIKQNHRKLVIRLKPLDIEYDLPYGLDYDSLYPSIIMNYNIDYGSFC